jgi:integrase/recombinase XerD
MNQHDLALVSTSATTPSAGQLDRAVAAYLTRFTGSSREHARSDLRCFLTWCAERNLDPLAARRLHLGLYIRWMQEIRRFKPSMVSRRFSVVTGFHRTAVIDGVLDESPAGHVRRPAVPPASPTLVFTHLQFEAMLTASRESANASDFALIAMLGLLGLRIFEATSANITDLGEEHGHRVLRECGKGTKIVLIPCHPPSAVPAHAPAHLRDHDAGRGTRPARCPDRRTPRRSANQHALRPGPPEPRPPPELHPRCLHGLRHMTWADSRYDLADQRMFDYLRESRIPCRTASRTIQYKIKAGMAK